MTHMLSRLRIGAKLLLAPSVVLLLLVLLSCGAYTAMLRQNQSLDTIVQHRAAHIRAVADLASSTQRAHAQAYQALTWISGSFPRTRVEPLVRDLGLQHAAVDRGLMSLARLTRDNPAGQRSVDGARNAWQLYVAAVQDVIEIATLDQSISASAMSRAERAFAVVAQRLAEVAQREQQMAEVAATGAAEEFRIVAFAMPVAILLSIVISLAITMVVRHGLLTGIAAIEAVARGLASGDLTARPRMDGDDEIATTSRALDDGLRRLNGNLRAVLDSARAIGAASREIRLGRDGLPQRAGMRGAVEQGADAVQALAKAARDHADMAQAARKAAQAAGTAAQEGGACAHRLVASMEEVRRATSRLDQVGTLLEATLEPALQARAHDLGVGPEAGPAPVLAGRALLAVREARALAQQAMTASQGSTALAVRAGVCMAGVADATREIDDLAGDIGSASEAQERSLSGASQAILRVDTLTQQGTRMVEEAAQAARALQQQALDLSRAVAAFRLDEAIQEGAAGAGSAAAGPIEMRSRAGHPYLRLASSRK
jgi:methyl-accepting chemotaxis protein